jgi:multisubunit Na+/H+ antiporter MnhC subunit
MFSTSSLYFLVAIFGEGIESSEGHGLQLVEGQKNETMESAHNENQEKTLEIHNESGESSEQRLQEEQAPEQNTNESRRLELKETKETLHQETSENQRRVLEFPLSIIAGIGYAAIGLWMILDRRNSKIPYIIAIVGSAILLVIYSASRTVGISSLGKEPLGLVDTVVGALQVAIIAISLYILFGKIYTKGVTVRK